MRVHERLVPVSVSVEEDDTGDVTVTVEYKVRREWWLSSETMSAIVLGERFELPPVEATALGAGTHPFLTKGIGS